MKMFTCKFAQDEVTHQRLRVGSKKSVQQGRSHFYARSVCVIREHGKMARTPLAAFFNRPFLTVIFVMTVISPPWWPIFMPIRSRRDWWTMKKHGHIPAQD
jgi:hypothetical protein